ncbi:hypothetical protein ACSTHX_00270, partial [Vibrio parahaemolyticus]
DMDTPLKGPFEAVELCARAPAQAALRLAMLAGILPAFFVIPGGDAGTRVTDADIDAHEDAERLTIAARARLPVAAIEDA